MNVPVASPPAARWSSRYSPGVNVTIARLLCFSEGRLGLRPPIPFRLVSSFMILNLPCFKTKRYAIRPAQSLSGTFCPSPQRRKAATRAPRRQRSFRRQRDVERGGADAIDTCRSGEAFRASRYNGERYDETRGVPHVALPEAQARSRVAALDAVSGGRVDSTRISQGHRERQARRTRCTVLEPTPSFVAMARTECPLEVSRPRLQPDVSLPSLLVRGHDLRGPRMCSRRAGRHRQPGPVSIGPQARRPRPTSERRAPRTPPRCPSCRPPHPSRRRAGSERSRVAFRTRVTSSYRVGPEGCIGRSATVHEMACNPTSSRGPVPELPTRGAVPRPGRPDSACTGILYKSRFLLRVRT